MIDNFDLINSLLSFENDKQFYFLQILKRRKDNPGMTKDVSVIDNFYIYNSNDLSLLKNKIINLCTINNARACIRLNVRDSEKIALQTLKEVTDCILNKNYNGVKSAYTSCCGSYPSDKNKKWIIDIDTKDNSVIQEVIDFVYSIKNVIIYARIPTKNGFHLITSPFNPHLFKLKIDIHKDNPTILYIP
jgi:hypothetical protein